MMNMEFWVMVISCHLMSEMQGDDKMEWILEPGVKMKIIAGSQVVFQEVDLYMITTL